MFERDLNDIVRSLTADWIRERDYEDYRLSVQLMVGWESYRFDRWTGRQPDEQFVSESGDRFPTGRIFEEILQEYEKAKQGQWRDIQTSTRIEEDDLNPFHGPGGALTIAARDRIRLLVQERRQQQRCLLGVESNKMSIEWIKDSLRAALAAHKYCNTIISGHTNSTLEAVRDEPKDDGVVAQEPDANSTLEVVRDAPMDDGIVA